jgi:RHS repeat-associated protein
MEKVDYGGGELTKLYVYGPTGLLAVNDNGGWFFLLKDHLGSTRVVLNENNNVVSSYDYMPYGGIMRSRVNTDIAYQFTGQEYDTELGLHNFRARLYDSDLAMFYAVDPAGQTYSPFAYSGNNPVIYVDKDGRIFIIDDILIGAAIGALVSGSTYSLFAGDDWTWEGFGKAVGLGALSGGVGGAIGGSLPGFRGTEGGAFKNITSELIDGTAKGALMGGIGGGVGSLIDGRGFGSGFKRGFIGGAQSGFTTSALTIAAFGTAIKPDPVENKDAITAINNMERDFSLVGDGGGDYVPVYRSGGAWSLFTNRGIAMGRNLVIPKNSRGKRTDETFIHETAHFYQQNNYGVGTFLRKGLVEQYLHSFQGVSVYNLPGYQEWAAEQLRKLYTP